MAASAAPKKIIHHFVIGQQGQSIHLKGPFISREAAAEFVGKHRTHAPCWILPAEYFGVVKHKPLDGDGQPVEEG